MSPSVEFLLRRQNDYLQDQSARAGSCMKWDLRNKVVGVSPNLVLCQKLLHSKGGVIRCSYDAGCNCFSIPLLNDTPQMLQKFNIKGRIQYLSYRAKSRCTTHKLLRKQSAWPLAEILWPTTYLAVMCWCTIWWTNISPQDLRQNLRSISGNNLQ